MKEREEIYAILKEGRIVALAYGSLSHLKEEYRKSAILIDPIQVPQIQGHLQSKGGLNSTNMPTQFLEALLG